MSTDGTTHGLKNHRPTQCNVIQHHKQMEFCYVLQCYRLNNVPFPFIGWHPDRQNVTVSRDRSSKKMITLQWGHWQGPCSNLTAACIRRGKLDMQRTREVSAQRKGRMNRQWGQPAASPERAQRNQHQVIWPTPNSGRPDSRTGRKQVCCSSQPGCSILLG